MKRNKTVSFYNKFFQKPVRHVSDKNGSSFVMNKFTSSSKCCVHQVQTEKKYHTGKNVGHHSEIKSQNLCKIEYKKFCLNAGGGNYLVEEDIVGCNRTRW